MIIKIRILDSGLKNGKRIDNMDRIEEFWSRKLYNKSFEWMPPKDCNYAEFIGGRSGIGKRNCHFAIVIDTKKDYITLSIPMSLEDWQKKGWTI